MDGRVGERASYSVNIYIYIIYLRNPVRTSSKLKKKKKNKKTCNLNLHKITNIAYVPGTFIPNCRTEI